MQNKELGKLNFEELIRYRVGVPEPKKKYEKPYLDCESFCVSCEKPERKWNDTSVCLDQISHGCDTSDYEHILGVLPESDRGYIHEPIMFVAESPGGQRGKNCTAQTYKGISKYPPTKSYHWSPEPDAGWPEDYTNLPYMAGCYFAYLMRRYSFKNVYITNAVKCSMRIKTDEENDRENNGTTFIPYSSFHLRKKYNNNPKYAADIIGRHCIQNYLMKEIEIFQPRIIFTIGGSADKIVRFAVKEMKHPKQVKSDKNWNLPKELLIERLWHYSARRSRKSIVEHNNEIINKVLPLNDVT